MLKRLRIALVIATALTVCTAQTPAFAHGGWGTVDCSQRPNPGCELGAGTGGVQPRSSAPGGGGRWVGDSPGRGGRGSGGVDRDRLRCSYVRSDYRPPVGGGVVAAGYVEPALTASAVVVPVPVVVPVAAVARPGSGGAWYVYRCSGKGARDAIYRPPVFIPDAPAAPGAALPDPVALARASYDQLRLPSPAIRLSPAGRQLVKLPTWLWLDRAGWAASSATASVPGESVTAIATPTRVVWSVGDGSTVTCTGPGTPYRVGMNPAAGSPDCGHTYTRSSAGLPGSAYVVTATVHWSVTWAGAGRAGTFAGLSTTATAAVPVAESEALNSN